MSRRLTRQEMKKDEVRDTLASIFWWIESNYRQILAGVGAMIVLGLIGTGIYFYLESRQEKAHKALAAALPEAATADEVGSAAAAESGGQDPDTAIALESLIEEFGGTDAARIGTAYLGALKAGDGELDEARSLWQESASSDPSESLAAAAQVNLWSLDRYQGEAESVALDLEGRLQGESSLPSDLLLYQLALTYDDLGRSEEAGETYQRLIDDHPGSAYAVSARRQLAVQGVS